MKKKKYTEILFEVIYFDKSDVMLGSGDFDIDDPLDFKSNDNEDIY